MWVNCHDACHHNLARFLSKANVPMGVDTNPPQGYVSRRFHFKYVSLQGILCSIALEFKSFLQYVEVPGICLEIETKHLELGYNFVLGLNKTLALLILDPT